MRPSRNRLSTSNQRRVEISERKTWRKNGWPGSVLLSSPFFSLAAFPSLTYAVHYFKRNSPSRPSSPFIVASLSVCSFPVRLPSLDLPTSVYAANLRVVPLGRAGCHSYRTLCTPFSNTFIGRSFCPTYQPARFLARLDRLVTCPRPQDKWPRFFPPIQPARAFRDRSRGRSSSTLSARHWLPEGSLGIGKVLDGGDAR